MIKALLFDVFGTVVDWRSSVISECNKLEKETGSEFKLFDTDIPLSSAIKAAFIKLILVSVISCRIPIK